MTTKSELIAHQILGRIHTHDQDQGGVLTETTGAQGSAKTSVNLAFIDYTIKNYPQEKIFMSECYDAPLQVFKLKNYKKIKFFVKKDSNVIFRNRDNHLEEVDFNPVKFITYKYLYEQAKPGHVNVVFFGDRFEWMEFIKFLRSVGEWVHVYIEEISEIAPMFPDGENWHKVKDFAKSLKDVRKCMMNVHYNTQQVSDIHYECRNKVMIKIFLPGAYKDSHCRVTQSAIDNLEKNITLGNQAYLVQGGEFGKTRFTDIYKPREGYHYDAHVSE